MTQPTAVPLTEEDPLKRLMLATALMFVVAAVPASAASLAPADTARKVMMGGIGFRAPVNPLSFALIEPQAAPTIGIRQWFNKRVGFDLAVGYYQAEIKPLPEKFTGYTVDTGIPISIKRPSQRVNLILRPGFSGDSSRTSTRRRRRSPSNGTCSAPRSTSRWSGWWRTT